MASVKGQAEFHAFLNQLPEKIIRKVLTGAARTAANVIAEEARAKVSSDEVRAAIKVNVQRDDRRVKATVLLKGKGAFKGKFLEYGTSEHFISVADSQRLGMSVRRVNQKVREAGSASLVISGQFVGGTVLHPGARPHPFMRPALDAKRSEAIAAAQSYVTARVGRRGMTGSEEQE